MPRPRPRSISPEEQERRRSLLGGQTPADQAKMLRRLRPDPKLTRLSLERAAERLNLNSFQPVPDSPGPRMRRRRVLRALLEPDGKLASVAVVAQRLKLSEAQVRQDRAFLVDLGNVVRLDSGRKVRAFFGTAQERLSTAQREFYRRAGLAGPLEDATAEEIAAVLKTAQRLERENTDPACAGCGFPLHNYSLEASTCSPACRRRKARRLS